MQGARSERRTGGGATHDRPPSPFTRIGRRCDDTAARAGARFDDGRPPVSAWPVGCAASGLGRLTVGRSMEPPSTRLSMPPGTQEERRSLPFSPESFSPTLRDAAAGSFVYRRSPRVVIKPAREGYVDITQPGLSFAMPKGGMKKGATFADDLKARSQATETQTEATHTRKSGNISSGASEHPFPVPSPRPTKRKGDLLSELKCNKESSPSLAAARIQAGATHTPSENATASAPLQTVYDSSEDEEDLPVSQLRLRHLLLRSPSKKLKKLEMRRQHNSETDSDDDEMPIAQLKTKAKFLPDGSAVKGRPSLTSVDPSQCLQQSAGCDISGDIETDAVNRDRQPDGNQQSSAFHRIANDTDDLPQSPTELKKAVRPINRPVRKSRSPVDYSETSLLATRRPIYLDWAGEAGQDPAESGALCFLCLF